MRAKHRVCRHALVIESGVGRRFFRVAGLAFLAKLVLVNIILAVTGNTRCLQLLPIQRLFWKMARLALDLNVLVLERVFRIARMVEDQGFPVLFCMASFALAPVFAIVNFFLVIFAVATDTGRLKLHQRFHVCCSGHATLVTSIAFGIAMFAFKRVLCIFVVIEIGGFPAFFGVATLALFAQLVLMAFFLVILKMASHALHRQILFVQGLCR